ncbi:cation:proton antiporter [Alphaproteobacteria bacterium]|nr:cation:proton antiporter [Alphaproteobacteria bacterium]
MEDYHALTHIATVLAAAFAGGAVFQKMKQPVLVGYIIVGLLLGPSFLGVVKGGEDVSLMAELGILLLLFIAGMELDIKNFKSIAKISLATVGVQIGVGLITMAILGFFFDWPLNRIILLGFSVSLSSTAVALKIIDDMELKESAIGQNATGILIAQDIAFIPMLLILSALSTEKGFNTEGLIRLVGAMVVMGGLVYLLYHRPKYFAWIWEKFNSLQDQVIRGQTAITALAFCFAAAAIAGLLGISAAYGAFLAGLALGQTRKKKLLELHTKPIFDVTIMVFFLSIGLLIDLEFLAAEWLSTLFLLIVTMVIKTVVNIAVLKWQGMETNDAFVTGAVLGQVGEFAFILAAAGLTVGTIGDAGYKYVVAMISLSLIVTPIWLYLVRKFQYWTPPIKKAIKKKTRRKKKPSADQTPS